MKKNKSSQGSARKHQSVKQVHVKETKGQEVADTKPDPLDEDDSGFSGWLR